MAYIGHEGKKHNLLAVPGVIQTVIASQEKDSSPSFFIVPKKRKETMEDDLPEVFLPSIRNIILNSHCRSLLSKSNYVELDREIALWLNRSWTLALEWSKYVLDCWKR
ncbi:MAG: hypothetical protein EXX96DRAFT_542820 [Benjaminiella poitrasii]|nr:MAG: hypothetical protein EXX96DRAFT_542820 [Benjaminiella poitrasii]